MPGVHLGVGNASEELVLKLHQTKWLRKGEWGSWLGDSSHMLELGELPSDAGPAITQKRK